jgi:hypothetical protein
VDLLLHGAQADRRFVHSTAAGMIASNPSLPAQVGRPVDRNCPTCSAGDVIIRGIDSELGILITECHACGKVFSTGIPPT